MENKIIVFRDNELELEVNIAPDEDTVWLSLDQISALFQKNKSTVSRHIKNIFSEGELEEKVVVAKNATTTKHGAILNKSQTHFVNFYNLDVIISVGYRVKSHRGVIFRKWATNILRQYLKEGYAINERELQRLKRTVKIESNVIASLAGIDADDVLKVIQEYSRSLELLDSYDHQNIELPKGSECLYRINYAECMDLIQQMEFSKTSQIFGTEKEPGKLEGILSAIYQSAFGQEAYPTLEEKAANLLYFLIKDHPFNDGCKRIAAALFLYFLNNNKVLYKNNRKVISDSALVAITLMIAESQPSEKEAMIKVVMNFLHWD